MKIIAICPECGGGEWRLNEDNELCCCKCGACVEPEEMELTVEGCEQ